MRSRVGRALTALLVCGGSMLLAAPSAGAAPVGAFTEFPVPTASSYPLGIAAGPDGNLWFAEVNGDAPEARVASAGESCDVYVAWIKMVYPGNSAYAQALIGNECTEPLWGSLSTYGCGELDEYWISDHTWHDMSYVCGSVTGPNEWDWSYPSAYCKASYARNYRARGYGTVSDATGVYGYVTPWTYKDYMPCWS